MSEELSILLVEDAPEDAELIERQLRNQGLRYNARRVATREELLTCLAESTPDLALADLALPGFSGIDALNLLKAERPHVPLIFVAGTIGEALAIDLLKLGAADFVRKDQLERLAPAIERALREFRSEVHPTRWGAQYRDIVERAVIGIFQCSGGRYLSVNPRFASLHGYDSPEELIESIDDIDAQVTAQPGDYQQMIETIEEKGFVLDRQIEHRDKAGRPLWLSLDVRAVRDAQGRTLFYEGFAQDVSQRKAAGAGVEAAQARAVAASRYAGMSEVATNVLHNVGNVLNSVNVSTSLITEWLRNSEQPQVARVAKLLRDHQEDLPAFLEEDDRGRQLVNFLEELASNLQQEHDVTLAEVGSLVRQVEHINAIVATQQHYATLSGLLEMVDLSELVEDALRMNAAGLARHAVEIVREYSLTPLLAIERHKVLQILVNLISNAKYALDGVTGDRRVIVNIRSHRRGFVAITVRDCGIGIPPEHLPRIFEHGFSTRKGGHGFGLHGSALAAHELGGSLTASSEGAGKGATFVLELPMIEPPL
jgi:PAS domain S-box-containing protein